MNLHSLARPAAGRITGKNARSTRSSVASVARVAPPRRQTRPIISCSSSQRAHFHVFWPARIKFQLPFVTDRVSPDPAKQSIVMHGVSDRKNARDGDSWLGDGEGDLVVVLLGWLGAQHKHLKKYAEWYNSRGISAMTFVMPMPDLLSLGVIGKADRHVDLLYAEIKQWLASGGRKEKSVLFHTFSNTGWFFYGALLEKLQQQGQQHLTSRIKGCVVDSGPAAELSPQVWASGFATAFLKKQSFSTQSLAGLTDAERAILAQPSASETLLLAVLEKFFAVLLAVPAVKLRLARIISILSSKQPRCPQLYIYSSADRVIPASYVEEFMDLQKKSGYKVSCFDMRISPHVDHLRSFPALYHEQLEKFFQEILPEKTLAHEA
ncbi:transmembrane protein 53 [Selaginella moellendorffii]|nr:transmembrane protein 53 [Selaginella moellendorffii]|eukprot:XP_002974718.2 transmembrane protein 53 [Selaginella moellendorffii]